MEQITKYAPLIILVLLAAALGLGGAYLEPYADKIPFVVEHREHLAIACAIGALIYAFAIAPKEQHVQRRVSQDYLPSYSEATSSI